jgi:outer membrane protein
MRKTGNIALILSAIALTVVLADKFLSSSVKKIGIVQMDKLVYDFKGMKEATKKYEGKMANWTAESDSMQKGLNRIYNEMKIDSVNKDFVKLKTDIELFQLKRQSYAEYVQNAQSEAQNEDHKMTVGVINQINEYLKQFAEKEGYEVIVCNQPETPAIGYVQEKTDITKQALAFCNQQYEGGK